MAQNSGLDHQPFDVLIDYQAISLLFETAGREGRDFLYEQETYRLLEKSGAETVPKTNFFAKGTRLKEELFRDIPGERIVLKIVSPTIVHKTEVGGVRVVDKTMEGVNSGWRRMLYEVPETYAGLIEQNRIHVPDPYGSLSGDTLRKAISGDIRGVLLSQFMPPDSEAFGNELIVGIRNSREFGMIISAGLGGTDTELYAERFRKGQAVVAASCETTDGETFFELFRNTICYRKLAGLTRGQRRIVTDEQILECFTSMIALANYYSPVNPSTPFVIDELEINPFAFTDFMMVPLDGMCRFSLSKDPVKTRPVQKIGKLLNPGTIGIIGVSASRVNFGRIILDNILKSGFDAAAITIIRPGMKSFQGIDCVPDLESLEKKLDLLVVAVGSEQVPAIVEQVIEKNSSESVMLIAGGMGETGESAARAAELMEKIEQAHEGEDGGPVFLGANCLGVISHPGNYDTLFIPDDKLPKQRGERKRTAAFVSQSGAFMITRLSKCPELDPAYMVSVGNQNDLTLGDMLMYLKDDPDLDVIGVYAEGFKDLDGLSFIRAVRDAVIAGKCIVFYKAGRTPEGKNATSGHTASVAGDYMVCESCVRQAGGVVAQNFSEFEDLLMLSQKLHNKVVNGKRLAAVSGAGFEAVGIADNIHSDDFEIRMSSFSPAAVKNIETLLEEKGLRSLVEVKNPLDINPGADDEVHVRVVKLLAEDSGVDAVVVGLDPLSPAMRTLAEPDSHRYGLENPGSIANALPGVAAALEKPIVGVVDGGRLYDPLVDVLIKQGMAVFRSSDRAVHALALYLEARLHAERLRRDETP